MPCACSFSAVFAPTPQSRRTGSGCRNASSRSGGTSSRPSGLASWLATLARNLVRAMPTVIGRPTRSRTCARSRAAISHRGARHPPQARRRRERPRRPTAVRPRGGVVEHLEHRVAGLRIRRHPRRHHDRVRTQPQRLPTAHRGAHAVGLGFVAGREHDAAADDHRPAPQRGVVSLLDRRVERVEVSVQDGRRPSRRIEPARTRTYVRIEVRRVSGVRRRSLVIQTCARVSSAASSGNGRLSRRERGEHRPLVHQVQRGRQVLSRHGVRRRAAGPFGRDDRRCAIDPLLHERRPELRGPRRWSRSPPHRRARRATVSAQGFEEGVDAVAPGPRGFDGVVRRPDPRTWQSASAMTRSNSVSSTASLDGK